MSPSVIRNKEPLSLETSAISKQSTQRVFIIYIFLIGSKNENPITMCCLMQSENIDATVDGITGVI